MPPVRSPRALALALGLAGAGCATRHTVTETAAGELHTLRRHHNNTHVLRSPQGTVIVDGGLPVDAPALVEDLRGIGLTADEVKLVIVTHGHADHAGGTGAIAAAFDAPVLAGTGDAARFETGRMDPLCPTGAIARKRLDIDQNSHFEPRAPELGVAPDAARALAAEGLPGTVHSLPGHTTGSLVYAVGDVVFVGDLIRGSIVGRRPTTHFYMCDLDDNRADVVAVLDRLAPDARLWLPGHFGPLQPRRVRRWAGD